MEMRAVYALYFLIRLAKFIREELKEKNKLIWEEREHLLN